MSSVVLQFGFGLESLGHMTWKLLERFFHNFAFFFVIPAVIFLWSLSNTPVVKSEPSEVS